MATYEVLIRDLAVWELSLEYRPRVAKGLGLVSSTRANTLEARLEEPEVARAGVEDNGEVLAADSDVHGVPSSVLDDVEGRVVSC